MGVNLTLIILNETKIYMFYNILFDKMSLSFRLHIDKR